jgi:phosphoesterase RecJ-like protein
MGGKKARPMQSAIIDRRGSLTYTALLKQQMEPTPKQQTIALINRSNRILIVPGRPDGDSIGSALAMLFILRKVGKEVAVVTMDAIPDFYNFLPSLDKIQNSLVGLRDFIITLNGADTEPEKLSYNIEGGQLNIVITPKTGSYSSENVSFSQGGIKYDLIITLDSPDLGMLGTVYSEQPALFKEVPVINIDHHASNRYFGAVNLVDLTATSTGEILVSLAEALNVEFDADIATCLLTGIISDTGSFQHSNTTPKSLTVAAQMVGFGARQQEIIKHLFKTKPLVSLRLWGKILSAIQYDKDLKFVWAGVDLAAMESVGATGQDIGGLIDELLTSVPGAEIVALLSEREPRVISGSLRAAARGVDVGALAGILGGGGHPGAAGFTLVDTSLSEATNLVLAKVREFRAPATPADLPPKIELPA